MNDHLFLDAAYPPFPAELLLDLANTGADGCFLYVWGPIVNWTPYHRALLQQAGFHAVPIVVPGNAPGDPIEMVNAVNAWGWPGGPVIFDFEGGSDPGSPWFQNAVNVFAIHGYRAEPYGTSSFLDRYDPEDRDWVANWIRTGILDPIPTLPAGWEAWQFVNDIIVNGHTYDASIVSDVLLGEDMTPQQEATLNAVNERTAELFNLLAYGATGQLPDGTNKPLYVPFQPELDAIKQGLADLSHAVANLPPGGGLSQIDEARLANIDGAVARIETALKGA